MSDDPDRSKNRSSADEHEGYVIYHYARTQAYTVGSSAAKHSLAAIFAKRDNSTKNNPLSKEEIDSVLVAFVIAYSSEYDINVAEATVPHPPDHILQYRTPETQAKYWWDNVGKNLGP